MTRPCLRRRRSRARQMAAALPLPMLASLLVLAEPFSPLDPPRARATDEYVAEHYTKIEEMVPMRDGAKLYTAVYVPRDTTGTNGIIFQRTAYGVGEYGDGEMKEVLGPNPYYARAGFIFAYQDIRGTFKSEGEFSVHRPYVPEKNSPAHIDESSDTYDTIEWMLENVPGHNGKVMLWGTSYSGWLAAMALLDPHPSLVAVLAQGLPIDMWMGDDFHHNGAFRLMYTLAWTGRYARKSNGPWTERRPAFDHGTPDGYRFFLKMGPLKNADSLYFHGEVPAWNEFMEHGDYDEYWRERNPLPHLARFDIPLLVVAGWFDGEDFYGPMALYRHIEETSPDNNCRLIVGPWRHSGWNWMAGDTLGDLRFGSRTCDFFRGEVEFPFFAANLSDSSSLDLPEALVFETGANVWHSLDSWPPSDTSVLRLYLSSDGRLSREPPATPGSAADRFVSDPDKPVPWSSEIRATQGHRGMYEDQRFASSRPDVLVYESEVLEEDLTVAGPIEVTLYASTSGTDADWIVKLIDVFPGDQPDNDPNPCASRLGHHQMLLSADVFRSKYRNSFTDPAPLVPGEVTEISFELPERMHRFLKGHRIMVHVQSTWFPVIDRNPQTFVDIYSADESDFRKATHAVHRSKEHPSNVGLRVMRREESDR